MGALTRIGRSTTALLAATLLVAATGSHAGNDELRFAEGLEAYDAGDFEATYQSWHPLAEAGHVEAQTALADLYMKGLGVTADPAVAADWYHKASQAGDPIAQLNLGELYARGLGVPQDWIEAYAWLSLSAEQGKIWPAARRAEIAARLNGTQLDEAKRRIDHYRP